MSDSYFPLYPFESDPLRILSIRRNTPPAKAPEPAPVPENRLPSPDAMALSPEEARAEALRMARGDCDGEEALDGRDQASPPAETPAAETDACGARTEGTETAPSDDGLRAWLTANWGALRALEAEGRLRDLIPPGAEAPADESAHGGGEPPVSTTLEAAPEQADAAPAEPDPPAEQPRVHVARGDRWTKKKMADFLRQLAATHSVTAAARSVGMSRESAHRLRNRLKGQPFDIAWEAAFRHGYDNLAHAALELAIEGQEVPHYHRGELIATHRKPIPQLIIALLKLRNQVGVPMLGRYGAAAEYHGEHWDALLERVETGSVDWSDERAALGEEGLKKLDVPDKERELKLIELRNLPDDGPKRRP